MPATRRRHQDVAMEDHFRYHLHHAMHEAAQTTHQSFIAEAEPTSETQLRREPVECRAADRVSSVITGQRNHLVCSEWGVETYKANLAFHPSVIGIIRTRFGWEGKGRYGSFRYRLQRSETR